MIDLAAIQTALTAESLDGWLLYDFRGNNPVAQRVLGLPAETHLTRRLFCYIPASGEPRKLVHRIEQGVLDGVPGELRTYASRDQLSSELAELLQGAGRVAMEYAPGGTNPYVSLVDAGTVEMVRSLGLDVVSSGDIAQRFEAVWSDSQWESHREASTAVLAVFDAAWGHLRARLEAGDTPREYEVQQLMVERLASAGLVTDHPPIVAVGPNSGNAHYCPIPEDDAQITRDAFVLVDAWGRLDHPDAVYADYTRVAYTGAVVPEPYAGVFEIVRSARNAAVAFVEDAFAEGRAVCGWQVDEAARRLIDASGYGEAFVHRTGHSIGRELHGRGANMDNLETKDERVVLSGTGFSIEPGIYLPEFGVRSEVNVYVDHAGGVHVTGDPQEEVLALLAR